MVPKRRAVERATPRMHKAVRSGRRRKSEVARRKCPGIARTSFPRLSDLDAVSSRRDAGLELCTPSGIVAAPGTGRQTAVSAPARRREMPLALAILALVFGDSGKGRVHLRQRIGHE